jgi:hypothetical protein
LLQDILPAPAPSTLDARHTRPSVLPTSSASDDAGDPVGLDPAILWHGAAYSLPQATTPAAPVPSAAAPGSRDSALRPPLQQAPASTFGFTAAAGRTTSPTAVDRAAHSSGTSHAFRPGDSFPDGLPATAYAAVRLHRDQLGVSAA